MSVLLLKGWVSGISELDILVAAKKITCHFKDNIPDFIAWDGDLIYETNFNDTQERELNLQSFTKIIPLLKIAFPNTKFVAMKKSNETYKLESNFAEQLESGRLECGYPYELFGNTHIVLSLNDMKVDSLNIIESDNDTDWTQLGINHAKWWKSHNIILNYITIGGGDIVNTELENLDGTLNMLWRLPISRIKNNKRETITESCIFF